MAEAQTASVKFVTHRKHPQTIEKNNFKAFSCSPPFAASRDVLGEEKGEAQMGEEKVEAKGGGLTVAKARSCRHTVLPKPPWP